MKDSNFINKAILWAEKQGFTTIKANLEDYEMPTQYTKPGEEEPFIPDVTGMQMDRKIYVEIATKADNIRRKVSKWKLLSTLAGMKGGKLFLLAPRGHKTFAEEMVKKHHLNAKIIYLR